MRLKECNDELMCRANRGNCGTSLIMNLLGEILCRVLEGRRVGVLKVWSGLVLLVG